MLVAGFRGFAEYQKQSAWTWEHQALVRARVIAGDAALARRCNELRQSVLVQSRDQQTLAEEVSAMREKMRTHLLSARAEAGGRFHLKQGVGGIVDIEFMVQYAVLAWSHKHPRLAHWTDNIRILETLSSEGLMDESRSEALKQAYIRYRSAAHQLALQQAGDTVEAADFHGERQVVSDCWRELFEDA
jgi:glutamate-ammonia-ligase adenylyltransferase